MYPRLGGSWFENVANNYMEIVYMAIKNPTAPPSIGRQLVFAAAAGKAVCGRMLEPHGLSLAQWAVLQLLWRNGSLCVKAIAEMTGNEPPAASRIVDRMVAAGLVLRAQDPDDRRAVTIGLAEKGESLRHLERIYEQVNAVLLANLSEAECATLSVLLAKVQQSGRDWLGSCEMAEAE
jgi:DNA-binding MarR family transcriptional regulator